MVKNNGPLVITPPPLLPKQLEAFSAKERFVLYGGTINSGKSIWICLRIWDLAMRFPKNKCYIMRKEMTVLKRTTHQTWQEFIPKESIADFQKAEMTYTMLNGSKVFFMEVDERKDPDLEKLRSIKAGAYAVDEATQISEKVHGVMAGRLSWVPPGVDPRRMVYRGLYASNPQDCWLRDWFIDNPRRNCRFVQALPTDNPFNPPGFIESCREQMSEADFRRFVLGDWHASDEPDQLIRYEWVRSAYETRLEPNLEDGSWRQAIGADIARYGDDATVLVIGPSDEDRGIVESIESYGGRRGTNPAKEPTDTGLRLLTIAAERSVDQDAIGVDIVGLGAGAVGRMREEGVKPAELSGGGKPDESRFGQSPFGFDNLRSQMLYALAQDLRHGRIDLTRVSPEDRKRIAADLSILRYEITDRKICVESKKKIKARIGRSPDFADGLAYWNWVRRRRDGGKTGSASTEVTAEDRKDGVLDRTERVAAIENRKPLTRDWDAV